MIVEQIVRSMPSNANKDTCIKVFYLYYTFSLLIIDIYFNVQINPVMSFQLVLNIIFLVY